jgi:hypothetical protein
MDIKLSVPVTLFDFKASDNPLYSLAKLKVFYVGQTADKRLFTKKFSDELIKTLPNVPVVGYYDTEKGDFKGHNGSIQHIYGHVPESTTVDYLKEEGREFAICDIILYTGRKDETGEIAQKIVGKAHSLELNPEDTTYTVNKDANGRIQNIEFTSGSLVGLSVLGDDEKPAFAGSEFFTVKEDNFEEILNGFKTEWEKFTNKQKAEKNNGMKNQMLGVINNFFEKTYTEKVSELYHALREKFEYFYIAQVYDNYCVIYALDTSTGVEHFYRISYSSENSSYSFGQEEIVLPRYLTEQEIADWETLKNAAKAAIVPEEDDGEEDDEDKKDFTAEVKPVVTTEGDIQHEEQGNQSTSVEQNFSETEEGKENKDLSKTTLINSERIELETFRKEKKLSLIESFAKDLSRQFVDSLINEIDKYSIEELEVILSKEFTKEKRNKDDNRSNKFVPLTSYLNQNKNQNDGVIDLIEKYKSKE